MIQTPTASIPLIYIYIYTYIWACVYINDHYYLCIKRVQMQDELAAVFKVVFSGHPNRIFATFENGA